MDLQELSQQGKVCLLTLPKADLEASTPSTASDASVTTSSSDAGSFLLLQLPSGWSTADLKDAKFIIPSPDAHAALVSDHKHTSFSVQRVETSNVLIMVPPASSTASKRAKVTEAGKTLQPIEARLLKKGGSGASFLELRPKSLRKCSVEQTLRDRGHVLDPYDDGQVSDDIQGRTVVSLACELQASESEVRKALKHIQAYPLPDTLPAAYILLTEEAKMECYYAIISALMEVEEYSDYANKGVSRSALVKDALQRMSNEERFDQAENVLEFCANSLSKISYTTGTDLMQLQLEKVASVVARRLFLLQTTPWEETLLLARWQTELPGVGLSYTVETSMLRGLAVDSIDEENDDKLWKYLPPESLPLEPDTGFVALFAAKEKWLLDDLQPYLDRWADSSSLSHGDLLLRFTKIVTEEKDGVFMKLYRTKE